MAAETSQTLDRGLHVLRVLAASPERADRHRAGRAGSRSTAPWSTGWSARSSSTRWSAATRGRLHVGLGVLHLASAVQPVLRDLAVPVLRALAEAVGCTAHLTVADGEEALALAVVEPSWTDFHVGYRVGSRHPLARVRPARRSCSAATGAGVRRHPGELQPGARGLAAPVRGVDGPRGERRDRHPRRRPRRGRRWRHG